MNKTFFFLLADIVCRLAMDLEKRHRGEALRAVSRG
jgi:hypothetical protein